MDDELNFTKIGPTDVFLLRSERGYLLVDTYYEGKLKPLGKGVARLGVGFDDIRYIVLTHYHNDHVGNLAALRTNDKFQIVAHRLTAERLSRGALGQPLNPIGMLLLGVLKSRGGPDLACPPISLNEDDIVFGDDGLDLQSLGVNARIVHTPGQCSDGVLAFGTPDAVRADTMEHIDRLSYDGGYVVSSSHSATAAIPLENCEAMIETAAEYGRY